MIEDYAAVSCPLAAGGGFFKEECVEASANTQEDIGFILDILSHLNLQYAGR